MKTIVSIIISTLVLGSFLSLAGCHREGPTERAGRKVDTSVQNTKDNVTTSGPMEKAGKKMDRTFGTGNN